MSSTRELWRDEKLRAEKQKADERRERFDPRQRFRPYRITTRERLDFPGRRPRQLTEQEWLAGAGCPTWGGIVPMLLQLHADGEFRPTDRIGVLDTGAWGRGGPATWVINPYED